MGCSRYVKCFYNVVDVNLVNNETPDTVAPSQPTELNASKVSANSVEITWKASTDNIGVKEYQVLRNGEVLIRYQVQLLLIKIKSRYGIYLYNKGIRLCWKHIKRK